MSLDALVVYAVVFRGAGCIVNDHWETRWQASGIDTFVNQMRSSFVSSWRDSVSAQREGMGRKKPACKSHGGMYALMLQHYLMVRIFRRSWSCPNSYLLLILTACNSIFLSQRRDSISSSKIPSPISTSSRSSIPSPSTLPTK